KATFGPANATTPDLVVHPLGEVSVRQRVLPLETQLQRLGGQTIAGDRRFTATNAKLGASPIAPKVPQVTDFFAMADYLELSDDQKLSRPAFETLKSGQAFTSDHLDSGDGEPVKLGYKTIIRRVGTAAKQGARYTPALEKFKAAVLQ